jgi:hypothetical protein
MIQNSDPKLVSNYVLLNVFWNASWRMIAHQLPKPLPVGGFFGSC